LLLNCPGPLPHDPRDRQKTLFLVGRYDDPATGQFLSVDPDVAQTGQPYVYTGDDPVNELDPLGLCSTQGSFLVPGACDWTSKSWVTQTENTLQGQKDGGFSITNGLKAVADYGAAIGNVVTSVATLGHVQITAPYCGFGWASDVGTIFGTLALGVLGGGAGAAGEVADGAETVGEVEAGAQAAEEEAPQYVYRVHGGDSGPWGRSWTPENPLEMSNPRDALGLPKGNSGQFLTKASVQDMTGATFRPAIALPGTAGGAPEIYFPDPANQLQELWTIPLEPPF
jgi:hypothetical protein